jgi:hypothetical protein
MSPSCNWTKPSCSKGGCILYTECTQVHYSKTVYIYIHIYIYIYRAALFHTQGMEYYSIPESTICPVSERAAHFPRPLWFSSGAPARLRAGRVGSSSSPQDESWDCGSKKGKKEKKKLTVLKHRIHALLFVEISLPVPASGGGGNEILAPNCSSPQPASKPRSSPCTSSPWKACRSLG